MKLFAHGLMCCEMQSVRRRIVPSNHSEQRRRCRWQTLVHRITTTRRVKSGAPRRSHETLLQRLSPSRVWETQTDEPLWRIRVGIRHTRVWDRVASC